MVMKPERIQLSRRKGWRMPPNTVKVDRSTPFGNPFRSDSLTATGAVLAFRMWLLAPVNLTTPAPERRQRLLDRLHTLRGKNLACWCPPGAPCHADTLLELANG
jgi:hypothetical protein